MELLIAKFHNNSYRFGWVANYILFRDKNRWTPKWCASLSSRSRDSAFFFFKYGTDAELFIASGVQCKEESSHKPWNSIEYNTNNFSVEHKKKRYVQCTSDWTETDILLRHPIHVNTSSDVMSHSHSVDVFHADECGIQSNIFFLFFFEF